jgi:hypothetical protein
LQRHLADRRCGRAAIPITVNNIGPEGLGLEAGREAETLTAGNTITVWFRLGGDTLQLPAQVRWVSAGPGPVHLGLRLLLEVAPSATRIDFARRVTGLIDYSRRFRLGAPRAGTA